ncbi:MAG: DUF6504 family protein [Anaerolineae bacterium]|jgi:hypothetical protein
MTRLWAGGEAITVWGSDETPAGFAWRGGAHRIDRVCTRWRVHTWWWEPSRAVCREYLKVVTEDGVLCQLYHDQHSGQWFLARLYD